MPLRLAARIGALNGAYHVFHARQSFRTSPNDYDGMV